MENNFRKQAIEIIFIMMVCVGIMLYVDGIVQPGYLIKSIIKVTVFFSGMLIYCLLNKEHIFGCMFAKGVNKRVLLLAIGLYLFIVTAYFISTAFFDYSGIKDTLLATTGVSKKNFLFVSLYVSFVNSFLEEIFFRGFGYQLLKQNLNQKVSCLLSAIVFALYHCAMLLGWINWLFYFLLVVGLIMGGVLFNLIDEKTNTITSSWLVHMFANFAINTIGFMIL